MLNKKILVVGKGKWGTKFINELKKINDKIKIIDSKIDFKKINTKNLDQVFVLTNDKNHYKIVRYFLEKKIKVFCEKPLTLKYINSKKLFNLSKKNKTKLYVSDVEMFKNKIIKLKKDNIIKRSKYHNNKTNILNRLAYHDFYLLFNQTDIKRIYKIKILEKNFGKLRFNINLGARNFLFNYDLNVKKKTHKINNINFLKFKNNPLKKMIKKSMEKNINLKKNNQAALKSI